jgi:hypothetical protein
MIVAPSNDKPEVAPNGTWDQTTALDLGKRLDRQCDILLGLETVERNDSGAVTDVSNIDEL